MPVQISEFWMLSNPSAFKVSFATETTSSHTYRVAIP